MALNFRTGTGNHTKLASVGNEVCGFIDDVPEYGYFTTEEQIEWEKWLVTGDGLPWTERQCQILAKLLSLRLGKPVTTQEVMEIPDSGLVEAVFNFFMKERDRHTPSKQLLFVSGVEGQSIAVEYAKSKGACVVASPDLPDNYYVLQSPQDRADKFLVIADFTAELATDEPEIEESDLGKSSKPSKTSKRTGTASTGA